MRYLKALHDQLDVMTKAIVQSLPSVAIALIIIIVTAWIASFATRIADRITRSTSLRADLQQLIETIARLVIWIFGLLIAATMIIPGLTAASLFAGLGVGAVAVGFAFQDIFQNFLAGVLIMIRERMGIGDTVTCKDITGKVERITLRETHVRQLSGELTIVPNSLLFKEPVKVLTDQSLRRDELTIEIGYGQTPVIEKTVAAIKRAIEDTKFVSDQKPVLVLLHDFGGNIKLLVQWWTPSAEQDMKITRSEVMLSIRRAIDAEKLTVPPGGPAHMVVDQLPPLVLEGNPAEQIAEQAREKETSDS